MKMKWKVVNDGSKMKYCKKENDYTRRLNLKTF